MSEDLAGRLLVASPLITDRHFVRTVVVVLAHDDNGSVGLVLNRPGETLVGEHLGSWDASAADPPVLFIGGPVEPSRAIALEWTDFPVESTPVPGVGVAELGPGLAGGGPVRVFSGYAGWGPGQLESELAEEAWVVGDAEASDVFTPDPAGLWPRVLRRFGGRYRLLATYPPDPALN